MKSEGIYYFTIPGEVREAMINGICNARRSEQDVCLRFIYGFVGEDYEQNDWVCQTAIGYNNRLMRGENGVRWRSLG